MLRGTEEAKFTETAEVAPEVEKEGSREEVEDGPTAQVEGVHCARPKLAKSFAASGSGGGGVDGGQVAANGMLTRMEVVVLVANNCTTATSLPSKYFE